jgi:hypothetical protein
MRWSLRAGAGRSHHPPGRERGGSGGELTNSGHDALAQVQRDDPAVKQRPLEGRGKVRAITAELPEMRRPGHDLGLARAPSLPGVPDLAEHGEHRPFSHDRPAERSPDRLTSGQQIHGALPFAHIVVVGDRRLGEGGISRSQLVDEVSQPRVRKVGAWWREPVEVGGH